MLLKCRFCPLNFASTKYLVQHIRKLHMKTVRCTLCLLRFCTLKTLKSHYVRKHSKQSITKQLMKYSSNYNVRPFSCKKIKLNPNTSNKSQISCGKIKKLYVSDNIHISYGNKEVIIEVSDNEDSLELSIDQVSDQAQNQSSEKSVEENLPPVTAFMYGENSNCKIECIKPNEQLIILPHYKNSKVKKKGIKGKRGDKHYKHFCLEFVKPHEQKSLDDKSGKFYICNCDKKKTEQGKDSKLRLVSSDTESSSDNGKYSFYPILDKKLYCTICGNGYRTKNKLMEHKKIHNFHCKACNAYFTNQKQYKDHLNTHVPVYCCHICSCEFLQKLSLSNHVNLHLEQETVKNVLELEQNYSHYLINFPLENYTSSINSITSFLTQSCDFKYNYSKCCKIRCHLCYMDIFKWEIHQHLKMHFPFENSSYRFQRTI